MAPFFAFLLYTAGIAFGISLTDGSCLGAIFSMLLLLIGLCGAATSDISQRNTIKELKSRSCDCSHIEETTCVP